jgi:hypothetical protein
VYFLVDESEQHFPGKSKELRGRWVGISEHIGNKMTYKIITDDTGEEVCRSAIRSALDPTMKNLREDRIEIEKDPISLEDILSPAEAISTKIKSNAMNDVQGLYYRKPSTETMEDEQGSHFKQNSTPTPSTTAPKRSSTNKKQRHECMPKLCDLHPKDPTKVPRRYPKRGNRTVKSGQTLTGEVRVKPSAISKIYHWEGQTLPDLLIDKTGLTSKVPFFSQILTPRGAQTLLIY